MALIGPDGISPISSQQGVLDDTLCPFIISIIFDRGAGLGAVRMRDRDGTRAFLMTPLEARMLGAELLVKSEGAICNAITMRMLTEPSMGNMPIEQAVQAIEVLGQATRSAHTIAELTAQNAKREKAEQAGEKQTDGKADQQ